MMRAGRLEERRKRRAEQGRREGVTLLMRLRAIVDSGRGDLGKARESKWDVDGNKEEEKAKKLRHQIIANTETPQDRLLSQSKILFD